MIQTKTNAWYQWWDTFQWWDKSGQWWDICPTIQAVKICPALHPGLALSKIIHTLYFKTISAKVVFYPNFKFSGRCGTSKWPWKFRKNVGYVLLSIDNFSTHMNFIALVLFLRCILFLSQWSAEFDFKRPNVRGFKKQLNVAQSIWYWFFRFVKVKSSTFMRLLCGLDYCNAIYYELPAYRILMPKRGRAHSRSRVVFDPTI